MGFLDRFRKPINRREQEARGFHNPPGYTGKWRSEEQKREESVRNKNTKRSAGRPANPPKGIKKTSSKKTAGKPVKKK